MADKPATDAAEPRIRLIIDTDEDTRHAIALRVMQTKVRGEDANQSSIVNAILRAALTEELAAVKAMAKTKGKGK